MRDIFVTPAKHEVVLHTEDPNEMRRQAMHLTYREAVIMRDALSRVLEHPSHRHAFIPQSGESKKSRPVQLEGEHPHLRIVE